MFFLQDLRFAARALGKSPLFTITATVSLALGLGALVTVFGLANGLFLKPLPGIAQPDRLVTVHLTSAAGERTLGFSYPEYRDLAGGSESLEGLIAWSDHTLGFAAGGEAQLLLGQAVSGNYFQLLGAEPVRGRFFLPEETAAPGGPAVAVVSHGLWRERFASDPTLVGRTVSLNGAPFTVVGVAPPGFRGLFRAFRFDVWTPLSQARVTEPQADLADRGAEWLETAGRLAPGRRAGEAEAELDGLLATLRREHRGDVDGVGVEVRPATGFDEFLRRAALGLVAVLAAVAGLVLVAACANVANLVLARGAGRSREIAIRLATGAGRGRIVSQLLAESLLLAVAGGLAGLLLAAWASDLFRLFQPPPPLTLDLDLGLDGRVVLFAFLASLAAAGLAGLAPALQLSRPGLLPALKEGGGEGRGPSRSRSAFVVAQVAVSMLLLVAAGLLLRTLRHAASVDPGLDPDGVEVAAVDLSLLRLDEPEAEELHRRLLEEARTLPGVESAALAGAVPLGLGAPPAAVVAVEGRTPPPGEEGFTVRLTAVSPGYFEAVRTPLVAGRGFRIEDGRDAPAVAVVNQTLAESFWPEGETLGRSFTWQGWPIRVVGVARDGKYRSLDEPPTPFVYLPFAQSPQMRAHLLVRRVAGAPPVAAELRRMVRQVAPDLPLTLLLPMRELVGLALLPQRLAGGVATVLGLLALLLAAVGLYGNVAYQVGRRTREIGVRMALGARRRDVLGLVVGQGLRLALVGVGVGVALALAASRLLAGLLHGVSATDPVTFAAIAALLAATALAASYLPARRAAGIDPVSALKS